jgi:transcriptional regulator GlxA family with amidase domain
MRKSRSREGAMAIEVRLVMMIVFDGVQMLDVVGPSEVFASATRNLGVPGCRVQIAAHGEIAVRSDSGLRLSVD